MKVFIYMLNPIEPFYVKKSILTPLGNNKKHFDLFFASVYTVSTILEFDFYKSMILNKTPLFKARNYESAMLLLRYGADPLKKVQIGKNSPPEMTTVLKELIKKNDEAAQSVCRAVLDECLTKQFKNDDLIMDFNIFFDTEDDHDDVSLLYSARYEISNKKSMVI